MSSGGKSGAETSKRKKPTHDPYDVLKLEPGCAERDIDKAYKKYALQWHPDKNPDRVERANEMFRRIYEAYEFLKDKAARREYEEEVLARKRRVEYDEQRRETQSKRRRELIDRLNKKEAAAGAKSGGKSSPAQWADNRGAGIDPSWWQQGKQGARSSYSGPVEDEDDATLDAELERLRREGAEMLRRDREEAELRARREADSQQQQISSRITKQPRTPTFPYTTAGASSSKSSYSHSNQPTTKASVSTTDYSPAPTGMSLDDFLRFEQEVLGFSAGTDASGSGSGEKADDDDVVVIG